MFHNLSEQFSALFEKIKGKAVLKESDTDAVLKDIRTTLLQADVELDVVKDFIRKARKNCIGQNVIQSVQPGHLIIKIVHDLIVELLGDETDEENKIELNRPPPVFILLVGLQGAGKTTTAVKLARYIENKYKKSTLLASIDIYRAAAQQQLEQLAKQANIKYLPIIDNEDVMQTIARTKQAAVFSSADVVIIDSAGRSQIDEKMMAEIKTVKNNLDTPQTILIADAMMGQQAANVAKQFHQQLDLDGIILTRLDGDSKGGAALSMRSVTKVAVKLVATGEKIGDLEPFIAKRIAGRILGMGDIVTLVEKAGEQLNQQKAEQIAYKMKKGKFDFNDLKEQIMQLNKMGGLATIFSFMPKINKLKKNLQNIDDNQNILDEKIAIINSMTPKERNSPKLLNASRKRRIAKGSATKVEEINKLVKMQRQMADTMKMLGKKKNDRQMLDMLKEAGIANNNLAPQTQLANMQSSTEQNLIASLQNPQAQISRKK